jgi:hypothetical protein
MAPGFYRSEEGKDLPDILIRLWIDDTPAKLDEVLIEGKRCAYAKSLHKDKAGAVDKAEPFVMIPPEGVPCFSFVGGRHANKRSDRFIEQPPSNLHCLFVTKTHPNQRDGFMDDHVAGDKESLIGLNKANSETMKPVGLISEGEERRRVNED